MTPPPLRNRVNYSFIKTKPILHHDNFNDDFMTTKLISTQLGTTQSQLVSNQCYVIPLMCQIAGFNPISHGGGGGHINQTDF